MVCEKVLGPFSLRFIQRRVSPICSGSGGRPSPMKRPSILPYRGNLFASMLPVSALGRDGKHRSEKVSAIWKNRGAFHGAGSSARSGTYRRHPSLDEAKRERAQHLFTDHQRPSTGKTLFHENVFL